MKKLTFATLAVVLGLTGLNGCSDKVTRKTTTYQQTSSGLPAGTVAPGAVTEDDGTTTTSKTTRRVEKIETD